jgi:hypothetical protein
MVARGSGPAGSLAGRSWDVLARDLLAFPGSWTVHSVFERAFNLSAPGGSLLGVVQVDGANGPATLVLHPSSDALLFDRQIEPGSLARVTAGTLTVGDRLAINLSPTALWSPPPIRLALDIQEIAERIVQVRARAAALAPTEGFGQLLNDPTTGLPDILLLRAGALIDNLGTAIRAKRWDLVQASATGLSGLGPGLTPSGDDVLTGLALGIRAGLGTLPEPLAEALHAAVEGRTTDLAVARVRHAVAGRADEAVHRLLTAMVSGPPDELDAAVRATIEYGHASGADTLVGIDRGLRLGVALSLEADR